MPTKLEAVNQILVASRYGPVLSLDTGGASDAAIIERIIDEVDQRIQLRGWYFNTARKVTLSPNGSDQIEVPANTLHIDSDDTSRRKKVVRRGDVLFDLTNNVDTFDDDLIVTYITRLDWDDIPPATQMYIIAEASTQLAEQQPPLDRRGRRDHDIRIRDLREAAIRAKVRAEQENGDASDFNTLNNAEANRLRGNRNDNYIRHSR